MIIHTKYHGQMNIKEEQIILFESGIPGFLEEKQFVILPLSEDSPFVALQSVTSENLAFIVVSPFIFLRIMNLTLMNQLLNFWISIIFKT